MIYDLKRVNPQAAVGVKLVSGCGVGTVAAGVAKAYADYIVIAGNTGGTGAAALSSIKYAGNPWELGLAEAQQVLMQNGMRGRVRLRTDGGLATARDVLIAALLGADEYAFGTAVLVVLGCDMARQCHLNTCPTGIATQKPELRAKFRGKPEHVVRFFEQLACDLQHLLARYGLPSIEAAIGRVGSAGAGPVRRQSGSAADAGEGFGRADAVDGRDGTISRLRCLRWTRRGLSRRWRRLRRVCRMWSIRRLRTVTGRLERGSRARWRCCARRRICRRM